MMGNRSSDLPPEAGASPAAMCSCLIVERGRVERVVVGFASRRVGQIDAAIGLPTGKRRISAYTCTSSSIESGSELEGEVTLFGATSALAPGRVVPSPVTGGLHTHPTGPKTSENHSYALGGGGHG